MDVKRINGGVALAVGAPCGAIGAALMKHGAFGLTPFYSVSLALYEATGIFSMGTWNTAFQIALVLTLVLIFRQMKPRYLLSFAVAAISSAILDAANAICARWSDAMSVRILCYAGGFAVMAFGIALMAECKLPVTPMNLFVRELAEAWNKPFRGVKLGFDVGCLVLSIAIALFFTGRLRGVGVGTIVSAALTGPVSGFYIAWIRKKVCFEVHKPTW